MHPPLSLLLAVGGHGCWSSAKRVECVEGDRRHQEEVHVQKPAASHHLQARAAAGPEAKVAARDGLALENVPAGQQQLMFTCMLQQSAADTYNNDLGRCTCWRLWHMVCTR